MAASQFQNPWFDPEIRVLSVWITYVLFISHGFPTLLQRYMQVSALVRLWKMPVMNQIHHVPDQDKVLLIMNKWLYLTVNAGWWLRYMCCFRVGALAYLFPLLQQSILWTATQILWWCVITFLKHLTWLSNWNSVGLIHFTLWKHTEHHPTMMVQGFFPPPILH